MTINKTDIQEFTAQFNLKEAYFNHHSHLHGIEHTYRVMTHCLVLGNKLQLRRETKLAFCGAFIHDMARKFDGKCYEHGAWAVEEKLPNFLPLFSSIGVCAADLEEIKTAVLWHSLPSEIADEHSFCRTVALLKDADALDRIRLSPDNLNMDYLRFPESKGLVNYAKSLYYETHGQKQTTFSAYLSIAELLID